MVTPAETKSAATGATRKTKLMQSDVPAHSAEDARRVPEALRDQYAKQASTPLQVAKAMNISPTSSTFKMITGSAVAYGFTDGAAQADRIGLTPLGRRLVAPTEDGDDVVALREGILKPRVTREFLTKYDGHRVPNRSIAMNVLEEMGVPADKTERALDMILANARVANFISVVKGADYIELEDAPMPPDEDDSALRHQEEPLADIVDIVRGGAREPDANPTPVVPVKVEEVANNRVFITHGKNVAVVNQLKELLTYGGFVPVVSVENETLAKSIPDKVLDDMRSCDAGIVHVGPEMTLRDPSDNEVKMLNSNVLIEIGAALALYDKRLILLVEEGTELPSNLQGLYQARYSGGELTYAATMKLLKTFNEFKA